uniref:c-type cytochrome n=1 Tax=Klebsiella pneumoniae TaxID=573 RepID=UPI001D0DECF9
SLSGRSVNAKEAEAGKARFAVCSACHGTDGKGNPAFGAPNLTDNDWLFGDSRAEVTETGYERSLRCYACVDQYFR